MDGDVETGATIPRRREGVAAKGGTARPKSVSSAVGLFGRPWVGHWANWMVRDAGRSGEGAFVSADNLHKTDKTPLKYESSTLISRHVPGLYLNYD